MQNYLSIIYILLVCSLQGCISDEPKGTALQPGDSLPFFGVSLSDGSIVSNSSLMGKVGVIVFFNTDCLDCQKELPIIQQLWDEFKDDSQVVIAPIAREESEQHIENYWVKNNLTMPYSPQESRAVYNLFASSVIPRIFISNPEGIITFSSGDQDMPNLSDLKSAINSALNN